MRAPPDQIWLAGVYDQADFDDVVYFLTSTLQATESIVGLEANPRIAIAPKLYLATLAGPVSAPTYSAPLRAPPIA